MSDDRIIAPVSAFFAAKVAEHGPTPRGVDWNTPAAQEVRFAALLRVVDDPGRPFSLLDYGCGYGSLAGYLSAHGYAGTYVGYDVSAAMVEQARQASAGPGRSFTADAAGLAAADYAAASGIFNIKLDAPADAWLAHMEATVDALDRLRPKGVRVQRAHVLRRPPPARPVLCRPPVLVRPVPAAVRPPGGPAARLRRVGLHDRRPQGRLTPRPTYTSARP